MPLYIISAEVLASFTDVNKNIKLIQVGDYEIKLLTFGDNTTIFLRDITLLSMIQVTLKLYEDAFNPEKNFKKGNL